MQTKEQLMKSLLHVLSWCVVLVACTTADPEQTSQRKYIDTQKRVLEVKVDTPTVLPDTISIRGYSLPNSVLGKQISQTSLDSVVKALNVWNRALVRKNYKILGNCYTQRVAYYTKKVSRKALIKNKQQWLDQHLDYRQTIGALEVRYPNHTPDTVHCVFIKQYQTSKKSTGKRAKAVIYMAKNHGVYYVYKESDMASERATAHALPAQNLPYGEYQFMHDYLLDTRANQVLAHSFVNYYTLLKLEHTPTSARVEMYSYSGKMRMLMSYEVKDVHFSKGILTFKGAMRSPLDMPPKVIEEKDYETFRFKVLDSQTITLLKAGNTKDWEGVRFRKVKR